MLDNKTKHLKLIPAIDLMEGECVRLTEGRREAKKVYDVNPLRVAQVFTEKGAEWLHVVDLDGAFTGEMKNLSLIQRIVEETGANLQVGGGIRERKDIQTLFDIGVKRVVLGTKAHNAPQFLAEVLEEYGEMIVVGVDAKAEKVALEGWVNITETSTAKYLDQLAQMGVNRVVLTDISRDGKLEGPNLNMLENLSNQQKNINFILSGGISGLQDIQQLLAMNLEMIEGVILGKALYEGKLDYSSALELVKNS